MDVMLLSWEYEDDFRRECQELPDFNYWVAYDDMTTNDDVYNEELYERIQAYLLDWLEKNVVGKVYYDGDLEFEFELAEDRNRFDQECGDPVAFKLTWS